MRGAATRHRAMHQARHRADTRHTKMHETADARDKTAHKIHQNEHRAIATALNT